MALARALYSRAGIILMDDILSAVDAGVQQWLVSEALCGPLATGRTRILATHYASQCEPRAAFIVYLCNGTVKQKRCLSPSAEPSKRVEKDSARPPIGVECIGQGIPKSQLARSGDGIKPKPQRQNLTPESPYMMYFRVTGGARSWLLVAAATALQQLFNLAKSWWLKIWAAQRQPSLEQMIDDGKDGVKYYGTIYILLCFLSCFAIAARCFVWYVLGNTASEDLFEKMTNSLFGAPLWWIEVTPHGEIITRFTSDMSVVDDRLPHDIGYMIVCICKMASILFTR